MKALLIKILRLLVRKIKYRKYPYITNSSRIEWGCKVYNPNNICMYENTNIDTGAIIMNTRAKFIIKRNSGAAVGLRVITGNHLSIVGKPFKLITDFDKNILDPDGRLDQDVIIEEDVWIASNVTLLNGVHIGRGSEVGAGAVVRKSIPPYSVVVGNPAKIVGFKFTPEEAIEHEKALYTEDERLPRELLEKNYEKYFLKRVKEIKEFTRL